MVESALPIIFNKCIAVFIIKKETYYEVYIMCILISTLNVLVLQLILWRVFSGSGVPTVPDWVCCQHGSLDSTHECGL